MRNSLAKNLSDKLGGVAIYLKREDLNHTGTHKLNHAMAYTLVAKKMGKTKTIAETGTGQHGVVMAAATAYFGMESDIYMGKVDAEKLAVAVNCCLFTANKLQARRKAIANHQ